MGSESDVSNGWMRVMSKREITRLNPRVLSKATKQIIMLFIEQEGKL